MAKDDYYVIVAKILVFLYKRLKKIDERDADGYLLPMTSDFPIDEEYMQYVIEKLVEGGYVEKVNIVRAWGGDIVRMDISKMRITPQGIDFLRDHSTIRQVAQALKEAVPIAGLFMPS